MVHFMHAQRAIESQKAANKSGVVWTTGAGLLLIPAMEAAGSFLNRCLVRMLPGLPVQLGQGVQCRPHLPQRQGCCGCWKQQDGSHL